MLVLVPLAVLTGLWANATGTGTPIHPSVVHGMVALAILILSPWKSAIARRGFAKSSHLPRLSLALVLVVLVALVTGLIHATGLTNRFGPLTLMQVHVGSGVVALVLVFLHFRSHPVRPRRIDLDRRAFARSGTLAGVAALLWVAVEGSFDVLGLGGGDRRFTGSHERASFRPERLPVTSWFDDPVQRIDADDWRLHIGGRQLTLTQIEALPVDSFDALLDCTGGWYSNQRWSGVRLDRLIDPGEARSILVKSRTGYGRRFPASDVENLWLVTRLGGEPLSAGHGFPARIVAPGRRGFWWVKWVTGIEKSDVPWWLQTPFPVT